MFYLKTLSVLIAYFKLKLEILCKHHTSFFSFIDILKVYFKFPLISYKFNKNSLYHHKITAWFLRVNILMPQDFLNYQFNTLNFN